MKRFLRVGALLVVFVVGFVALWLVVTGFWLKGSLPRLSGEFSVEGLIAPVRIVRDRDGVPHIYAQSRDDALFGLGYVHGQDRLWQMAFTRRTVQGRLSELAGSSTVIADTLLRSLGLYRAAEQSAEHLSAGAKRAYLAYAAGVNAAVPHGGRPLPPEFFMLGADFDAWRPADSVAVLKGIALQLSANAFQEIFRLQLLKALPAEKAAAFNPPLPPEVIEAYRRYAPKDASKFADALDALSNVAPVLERKGASNNWVIGGGQTKSGKPMLANDPHLPLTVPGFWYLAHLHWPGVDAIGGSVPGVPGIVSGRTQSLAWGMTTTGADTEDLFWEKIDPEDTGSYLAPSGSVPFGTRLEAIKVRFGATKFIRIHSTRHGPVLPTDDKRLQALVPEGYALAMQWPALSGDDLTGESVLRLLEAPDAAPGTVEQLLETYASPIQSIVFAGVEGNIGLALPGRIPVRGPQNLVRGLLPSDGRNALHDWQGFLSGDERPRWLGGANDAFVTANNNVVPPGYKPMIALDFDAEQRATRIKSLLLKPGTLHTIESFRAIQLDDGEQLAMEVLPLMLAQTAGRDGASRAALDLLSRWDMHMGADKAEPLIYAAWMREFTRQVARDELGELFERAWSDRPEFITAVLKGDAQASGFCDDVNTRSVKESCADMLGKSLALALADLSERFGPQMTGWRWGTAHHATFSHSVFGFVPILKDMFGLQAPMGGGNSTVQRAAYRYSGRDPFAAVHGSGYRGIYDLGAPDTSLFMASTGQSGNIFSPFYADLSPRWAKGEYLSMTTREAEIGARAVGTILLKPGTYGSSR